MVIELQSANIETDQTVLYITGNLKNGENVTVGIDMAQMLKVSIDPDETMTWIGIHWPRKESK